MTSSNTSPSPRPGVGEPSVSQSDSVMNDVWREIGRPDLARSSDETASSLAQVVATELDGLSDDAQRSALRRCLRTTALAIRRIADARVQTLLDTHQQPTPDDENFEALLLAMWRDQLRRSVTAATTRSDATGRHCAIGFVDLAGYSARSQVLPADELVELIDRFDSAAATIIGTHDATLIKTIGDEVMFRHEDPVAAAEIAAEFLDRCARDDLLLHARAGLAWGTPVEVAGDLYGPTVNLAARLVQLARPDTVLVDEQLASRLDGHPDFVLTALRPRPLRGCGMHTPFRIARRPAR